MNRPVKTFLVWLLMTLLPLHAFAASAGMSCAPVRQELGQALAVSDMNTAHHQAAGEAHAHAHHGSAHALNASDGAADDTAPQADTAKKAHSSCSACSALCVGAVAPPSAFLPFPTFDGSDAVAASAVVFSAGFIPDGPQRPPRHPSA